MPVPVYLIHETRTAHEVAQANYACVIARGTKAQMREAWNLYDEGMWDKLGALAFEVSLPYRSCRPYGGV